MKMVYICSPLRGNLEKNIGNAVRYSKHAAAQGVLPLAPHTIFTQYLNDLIPAERQQGLKMGLELLARCDELWVYGSLISEGMRAEIQFAKEHNMEVKYQKEGELVNTNHMKQFKWPRIAGYYQKTANVKTINAVMLQYPDGNQQLTSGLLYSTPSKEYMSKWKAVERLSTSALCAMQNTIQNAIRSDTLFDVPDNHRLIQLLKAEISESTFSIYQLKNDSDLREFRFRSTNDLPAGIHSVNSANYDFVYTSPLSASDTLDTIFQKFNVDHPKDYTGHSLSVSDVIVLHQDGENTAYYVDSIGFKRLPEFRQDLLVKQDSIWAARNMNPPEDALCRVLIYNSKLQETEWIKGEIIGIRAAEDGIGWRYNVATKESYYENCSRSCIQLDESAQTGPSVLEKLNLMQQETGARPYVFTEGESPVVSLPAEADDYLTPEEKQAAIDLIANQSQSAQDDKMEQEESDTQDFEEDCSMDLSL